MNFQPNLFLYAFFFYILEFTLNIDNKLKTF